MPLILAKKTCTFILGKQATVVFFCKVADLLRQARNMQGMKNPHIYCPLNTLTASVAHSLPIPSEIFWGIQAELGSV